MKGVIHSYESLATLDGEGVRFGVFMSGCPLRCVYCHNPDTQIMSGEEISPDKLVKKIIRYKPYFGENGGVTFSGGEPLLQADFIYEVSILLKETGIKYTVDTSGGVKLSENVKKVLKGAQLVITDLKFYNNDMYRQYTGMDMTGVLKMLEFLKEEKIRTWIRTVIIPGINDSMEHIEKYADIINGFGGFEKYELLPFHTMGFEKYEKSGIKNPLEGVKPMDKDKCHNLQKYADKLIKEQ